MSTTCYASVMVSMKVPIPLKQPSLMVYLERKVHVRNTLVDRACRDDVHICLEVSLLDT